MKKIEIKCQDIVLGKIVGFEEDIEKGLSIYIEPTDDLYKMIDNVQKTYSKDDFIKLCRDEILGIKGYCKDCKFFMNNFEIEENDITDYEDIVCTYHMADGFTSYDYCSMFEQKREEE